MQAAAENGSEPEAEKPAGGLFGTRTARVSSLQPSIFHSKPCSSCKARAPVLSLGLSAAEASRSAESFGLGTVLAAGKVRQCLVGHCDSPKA